MLQCLLSPYTDLSVTHSDFVVIAYRMTDGKGHYQWNLCSAHGTHLFEFHPWTNARVQGVSQSTFFRQYAVAVADSLV